MNDQARQAASAARARDAIWCAIHGQCLVIFTLADGHAAELRKPIQQAG